jgi:hypothetical protein
MACGTTLKLSLKAMSVFAMYSPRGISQKSSFAFKQAHKQTFPLWPFCRFVEFFFPAFLETENTA